MLTKFKSAVPVLLYGCLWGILELFLGGFLHSIQYPGKGYVMMGIGFTIMAVCVIRNRTFWHPIIIGCLAACFKFFNVFLYAVPLFSRGIINPTASIILESLVTSGAAFLVLKAGRLEKAA